MSSPPFSAPVLFLFGMFEHFKRYPWVLETYTYASSERLIAGLGAGAAGDQHPRLVVWGPEWQQPCRPCLRHAAPACAGRTVSPDHRRLASLTG